MKNFPAFLNCLFLLSGSRVCFSHIIIDPLILLDASSRLPALLLSAELQNVKDLANSIFSPENIDVLSAIAADTINMAKNTILLAQQSVDIQSITDAVTNSAPVTKLGSALDGLLSANPVLLSSPSKMKKKRPVITVLFSCSMFVPLLLLSTELSNLNVNLSWMVDNLDLPKI